MSRCTKGKNNNPPNDHKKHYNYLYTIFNNENNTNITNDNIDSLFDYFEDSSDLDLIQDRVIDKLKEWGIIIGLSENYDIYNDIYFKNAQSEYLVVPFLYKKRKTYGLWDILV